MRSDGTCDRRCRIAVLSYDGNDGSGRGVIGNEPSALAAVGFGRADRSEGGRHVGVAAAGCPLAGSGIEAAVVDGPALAIHDGQDDGISRMDCEVGWRGPTASAPSRHAPAAVGQRDAVACGSGRGNDRRGAVLQRIAELDQSAGIYGGDGCACRAPCHGVGAAGRDGCQLHGLAHVAVVARGVDRDGDVGCRSAVVAVVSVLCVVSAGVEWLLVSCRCVRGSSLPHEMTPSSNAAVSINKGRWRSAILMA